MITTNRVEFKIPPCNNTRVFIYASSDYGVSAVFLLGASRRICSFFERDSHETRAENPECPILFSTCRVVQDISIGIHEFPRGAVIDRDAA